MEGFKENVKRVMKFGPTPPKACEMNGVETANKMYDRFYGGKRIKQP